VARLTAVCDSVAVSCYGALATACPLIQDPLPHQGPAVGIATSLRFAQQHAFAACLFTPIDMPNLSAADLLNLRHAWQRSRRFTVAKSDRAEPLVAVYPIELLDDIDRLVASGDRSLTRWIPSQAPLTISLPTWACHNVNSPEDLPDGT
jgi:molybdopterin-guanine dinucleotide biosynthesis protein A